MALSSGKEKTAGKALLNYSYYKKALKILVGGKK
jgi:hypothetical protein